MERRRYATQDLSGSKNMKYIGRESIPSAVSPVLVFQNNLWGLGTEQEQGVRTGPPRLHTVGWWNRFSNQLIHPSPPTQPPISTSLVTHLHQLNHPSPPTQPPISTDLATHLHQLSHPSPPTQPPISTNLATHLHRLSHPSPPAQPPISPFYLSANCY